MLWRVEELFLVSRLWLIASYYIWFSSVLTRDLQYSSERRAALTMDLFHYLHLLICSVPLPLRRCLLHSRQGNHRKWGDTVT